MRKQFTQDDAILRSRFAEEGFILLSPRDVGDLVRGSDTITRELASWNYPSSIQIWIVLLTTGALVFVVTGVWFGYSLWRLLAIEVCTAMLSMLFQWSIRRIINRRAQTVLAALFGATYPPAKDQAHRTRSVSRWMHALAQVVLHNERIAVIVSVPALKKSVLVIDTYRAQGERDEI